MDVHDGFVLGIYNYCDRRCETCAFTSLCRAFADAPPLPQDVPPPTPRWLQECIDEMNEAVRELAAAAPANSLRPRVAPEHQIIDDRARAYSFGVAGWLQKTESPSDRDHGGPRSVLAHDCALIPAKICRALTGLASSRDEDEDWAADHDGSAKVALLAVQRSCAAWIDVVDRGLALVAEVEPFVTELGFLANDVDRVFPKARAFIRPAFDEPDEVSKLMA